MTAKQEAKTFDPGTASAADVQKFLSGLRPEVRATAEETLGTVLPNIPEGATEEPRTVALRCGQCNKEALEFLGSAWRVPQADGTVKWASRPQAGQPIAEMRWIQDKGRYKSRRRSEPVCQHCGNAVPLGDNGGIRVDFLVRTAAWNHAKTAAAAAMAGRKKKRNYDKDVGFSDESMEYAQGGPPVEERTNG